MADWKKELRPASFKGVRFEMLENVDTTGRRVHIHEYPNKDTPYAQDMGKKANLTNIEAFVIGSDYKDKRKSLKEACSSPGAGTLVHPTYGNLEVICTDCSISESYKEGGMAKLTLSFVESGEQSIPSTRIDYKDQISSSAELVEANAKKSFLEKFNIIGKASSVANSAADVAKTFSSKASSAMGVVNSKISSVEGVSNTGLNAIDLVTSTANEMSDLSANALNILKTPDVFASRLSACMLVVSSFLGHKDAVRQVKSMSNLGVSEQAEKINTNTPTGQDKLEQMMQIEVLSKRVGIATQAKVIAGVEFENSAEAQEVLNDFMDQVEEQKLLGMKNSDEFLQSLESLQAVLVKDISNTIKKLPEVKVIELPEYIPATVLAYNLYEDIDRASEISLRNKIVRPGFIPSGKRLEVLSK